MVTALMRCEADQSARNGVTYLAAPRSAGRLQRFLKLPLLIWQVLRFRADIYHLHNPDTLPVALCLRLLGRKVVYDTHEDYSRRLQLRTWIPRLLRVPLGYLVSSFERCTSYFVNATLVTQEGQLTRFSSRTYLLRNAPDLPQSRLERIQLHANKISRSEGTFYIVYVGGLSKARGLFAMLNALAGLNRKGFNVRLWLIGPDLEGCIDRARAHHGWCHVEYLGLKPHDEALAYMMRADVGVAILSDTGDHRWARPSKLFEYMACGLPFVASDFQPWRDFVSGKGGLWVRPDSAEELAHSLARLLTDEHARKQLGEQGMEFIKRFNWSDESRVLLRVYKQILCH